MPFSTGHRPPREGSGEGSEVVLGPGDVEVGFVMFVDTVGMPEEEIEDPVGAPEDPPGIGVVEVGTTDVRLEIVGTDFGGPVIETGEGLAGVGVEVKDPELELTAVALEEVGELRGAPELGAVELVVITGELEEMAVSKDVIEVERGD